MAVAGNITAIFTAQTSGFTGPVRRDLIKGLDEYRAAGKRAGVGSRELASSTRFLSRQMADTRSQAVKTAEQADNLFDRGALSAKRYAQALALSTTKLSEQLTPLRLTEAQLSRLQKGGFQDPRTAFNSGIDDVAKTANSRQSLGFLPNGDEIKTQVRDLGEAYKTDRVALAKRVQLLDQGDSIIAKTQTTQQRYRGELLKQVDAINEVARTDKLSNQQRIALQERAAVSLRKTLGLQTKREKQLSAEAALLQKIRGPQETFNRQKAALDRLSKQNEVSTRQYRVQLRGMTRELRVAQAAGGGLAKQLGVLKTVAIGITGAAAFGAGFSLVTGAFGADEEFARAIAQTETLTAVQKSQLKTTVQQISASGKVAQSQAEVARGLGELFRDGTDAATAQGILAKALRFATASGLDVSDSVGTVSEVLKAYALDSDNAEENTVRLSAVMDILAKGQRLTTSSTKQLSEAFVAAAPRAQQLDINILDIAAAVITFSEAGIKGAKAGERIEIGLRDLTDKAVKNKEAFKSLGIEVFTNSGEFIGLAEAAKSYGDVIRDASPAERVAINNKLGLQDKSSKALIQLGLLSDELSEQRKKIGDYAGAVDKMNDLSLTPWRKQLNSVTGALTNVFNNTVVAGLNAGARVLEFLNTNVAKLLKTTLALVAAVKVTLLLMSGTAFAAIATAIGVVVTAVRSLSTALKAASGAAIILQAVTTGPLGILKVLGGLAAGGATFVLLQKVFDNVAGLAEETNSSIGNVDLSKINGQAKDLNDTVDKTVGGLQKIQGILNPTSNSFGSQPEFAFAFKGARNGGVVEELRGLRKDLKKFLEEGVNRKAVGELIDSSFENKKIFIDSR